MSPKYLNNQKSPKITRCTKHYLGYSTNVKNEWLDKLFIWYKVVINDCLKWMYDNLKNGGKLKKQDNYKHELILSTQWEQIVYKNAYEIITSQLNSASTKRYKRYQKIYRYFKKRNRCKWFTDKKYSELNLKSIYQTKYFVLPKNENITITLDQRVIDFMIGNYFDEFAKIALPFVTEDSIRRNLKHKHRITINIPFKQYKHSNKYNKSNEWTRKKSAYLLEKDGKYFLILFYEKDKSELKKEGNIIGIDQGVNKLISTSDGLHFGKELKELCIKLVNKLRGSKNYKQFVYYKDTEIKRIINQFIQYCLYNNVKEIILENLKEIKINTFQKNKNKKKYVKDKNNKLKKNKENTNNVNQYWVTEVVKEMLEQKCELNGIKLTYIESAYTSQTCSCCGYVDNENRDKQLFSCLHCGYVNDADTNAAINILHRGVYSPSIPKNNKIKLFY